MLFFSNDTVDSAFQDVTRRFITIKQSRNQSFFPHHMVTLNFNAHF